MQTVCWCCREVDHDSSAPGLSSIAGNALSSNSCDVQHCFDNSAVLPFYACIYPWLADRSHKLFMPEHSPNTAVERALLYLIRGHSSGRPHSASPASVGTFNLNCFLVYSSAPSRNMSTRTMRTLPFPLSIPPSFRDVYTCMLWPRSKVQYLHPSFRVPRCSAGYSHRTAVLCYMTLQSKTTTLIRNSDLDETYRHSTKKTRC